MLILGIIFLVCSVIFLIVGAILYKNATDEVDGFGSGCLVGLGAMSLLLGIAALTPGKPKPTAMDVYQNKTELQYTVKGNTVIDSVVVFREESKQ